MILELSRAAVAARAFHAAIAGAFVGLAIAAMHDASDSVREHIERLEHQSALDRDAAELRARYCVAPRSTTVRRRRRSPPRRIAWTAALRSFA